jgi:hypothetical protein
VADQASSVGFEALLLSYGSGFDPASTNRTYIQIMKVGVRKSGDCR